MAKPRRHTANSVEDRLANTGYKFSFVQAVRLLQQTRSKGKQGESIGLVAAPQNECLKIQGQLGRSFPGTEVASIEHVQSQQSCPVVTASFMGIYGPCGVLPQFDNQRIIDAGTKKNVERELLDLFNHRLLSLFYRASTKYRIPFAYEYHARQSTAEHDLVTTMLLAIGGLGLPGLQRRLPFPDEVGIEFCQFFGLRNKNATSLTQMLNSYLGLPVTVHQFSGQWLELSEYSRSKMPTPEAPLGQNCQLGINYVIGDRVWDIQGKFCVTIGPLDRKNFDSLCEGSEKLRITQHLIRLYVGAGLDFNVQLVIAAQQVPPTQLDGTYSRLGINSWLLSQTPAQDRNDAVFTFTGTQVL